MAQVSYSDLYDIDHDRGYDEAILVGDLVRTGPNLYPHFTVIAMNGEKVWVRNVDNGADGITPITRCRKINGQPVL